MCELAANWGAGLIKSWQERGGRGIIGIRSGVVPVEIGRIRRNPGKLELAGWCRSVIGDSQQESDRSDRPVTAVRIAGRIPHEVVLRALLSARNGGGISCLVFGTVRLLKGTESTRGLLVPVEIGFAGTFQKPVTPNPVQDPENTLWTRQTDGDRTWHRRAIPCTPASA